MKKSLSIILVIVSCVFFISGCQSGGKDKSDFPNWIDNPPEGGISAVGSAVIGAAGKDIAKTEATSNARDEMARSMNVRVKNMIKNFTETTGVGDDQTVDKVFTNVSKQIAKIDLTGSQIKEVYVDRKTNEIFVLVALNPEAVTNAVQAMKTAAVTSFKNEQALWQKFQAKKGHEELEKEIEKEFGSM
jgi:ribosomal protein S20